MREKDARDIINIISHFFDLQSDLIYEYHADLFTGGALELEDISAIVISREIKKIVKGNKALATRINAILEGFLNTNEKSPFVRNMVSESGRTVEDIVKLIGDLKQGIS
ncbi:MAG TPA: hypothetical protein VGM63_05140 [Mucilaginibacter sp.]|jgi:hypothetical protein